MGESHPFNLNFKDGRKEFSHRSRTHEGIHHQKKEMNINKDSNDKTNNKYSTSLNESEKIFLCCDRTERLEYWSNDFRHDLSFYNVQYADNKVQQCLRIRPNCSSKWINIHFLLFCLVWLWLTLLYPWWTILPKQNCSTDRRHALCTKTSKFFLSICHKLNGLSRYTLTTTKTEGVMRF